MVLTHREGEAIIVVTITSGGRDYVPSFMCGHTTLTCVTCTVIRSHVFPLVVLVLLDVSLNYS